MSAAQRERALLLGGAILASVYLGLTAGHQGLGDYPGEAAPAINALLHGDVHAFLAARPSMGVLSLFLRVPFAALAYLGSATQTAFYQWGAVPCIAAMGLFAAWMATIARSRGVGLLAQLTFVAVALVNPLVSSALHWGHPEELLTASLAVGAVVAAAQDRAVLATILLGAALATKQWAILAAFPVIAILEARRVRVLAGSALIAGAVTLPAILANAGSWWHAQFSLVHGSGGIVPVPDSWPFLFASHETIRLPGGLVFSGPHLSTSGLGGLLHPLTILLAAVIAVGLAVRADRRARTDRLFAAVALVFVLRCTLDAGNQPYYHLPLLATLLAWDAMSEARIPWRALLGAAAAYLLFQRLPAIAGPSTTGELYSAVALAASLGLLWLVAGRATLDRIPRVHTGFGRAAPALPPVDGDPSRVLRRQ